MFVVKVINKESSELTHGADFATEKEAQDWIQAVESKRPNPWGRAGSYVVVTEDRRIQDAALKQERADRIAELEKARGILEARDPTLSQIRDVLRVLVAEKLEALKPDVAAVKALKK